MRLMPLIVAIFVQCCSAASAGMTTVFFDDFDGGQSVLSGVTAGWSGVTTTESVQGYAGIGTGANTFSGNFLRNTAAGNPATAAVLTLTGLPAHESVSLAFLLATIDSWDNSPPTFPPDFFHVVIDGQTVFQENFVGGTGSEDGSNQGYLPPTGVQLTPRPLPQLGFNTNGDTFDAAWNLGLDPTLAEIPHTSSTLTIQFFASGTIWQGGLDESWAIENVSVAVNSPNQVPEPGPLMLIVAFALPAAVVRGVLRTYGRNG